MSFLARRRLTLGVAAGGLLMLSVLDHSGVFGYRGGDRRRFDGALCVVTSAIDGEMIEVALSAGDGETVVVRIRGIDAARREGSSRNEGADSSGDALDFVRSCVVGRKVRLQLDPNRGSRDEQGRVSAYVVLIRNQGEPECAGEAFGDDEEPMLNELLIARGLARARREPEHVMRHRFVERELQAVRAKAGMWARVARDRSAE